MAGRLRQAPATSIPKPNTNRSGRTRTAGTPVLSNHAEISAAKGASPPCLMALRSIVHALRDLETLFEADVEPADGEGDERRDDGDAGGGDDAAIEFRLQQVGEQHGCGTERRHRRDQAALLGHQRINLRHLFIQKPGNRLLLWEGWDR